MPRTCTICKRGKSNEINSALLENEAYRSVAKRFGASESAVYRHQQEHLPREMVRAKEAMQEVNAGTLFERLRALGVETAAILKSARESGNDAIALQAIGRAEKQLELEARLLGEIDERVRVAVGIKVESPSANQQVAVLLAEVLTPDQLRAMQSQIRAHIEHKKISMALGARNLEHKPELSGSEIDGQSFATDGLPATS